MREVREVREVREGSGRKDRRGGAGGQARWGDGVSKGRLQRATAGQKVREVCRETFFDKRPNNAARGRRAQQERCPCSLGGKRWTGGGPRTLVHVHLCVPSPQYCSSAHAAARTWCQPPITL